MAPSRSWLTAAVLMMMSRISSRDPASLSFELPGRTQEAIEMRFEIVDAPVHQASGIEDAVTAMNHVIVEGNNHQRGVGDDTPS